MFPRLTWDEINGYKNSKKIEGLNLEYKDNHPKTNEDIFFDSLLEDICAFANSHGGDIILGTEEAKSENSRKKLGYIGKFSFYDISDFELFKTKINNKISSSIRPKIFSCDIYPIKLENTSECLFVIRIDSSINKPHMIHGTGKFYIRMSSGNQPMDVDILKSQIIDSESLERKIENFQAERLCKVIANEVSPFSKGYDCGILIHTIPLNSFSKLSDKISPKSIQEKLWPSTGKHLSIVKKFSDFYKDYKYNLDGLFLYRNETENYIQFFKNGILEIFCPHIKNNDYIYSSAVKKQICLINECIDYYKDLNFSISGGIVVFVSIFGIKNCRLSCNSNYPEHFYPPEKFRFDRNILTLNESLLEFSEKDCERTINNLCTEIAYASGFENFST